MKILIATSNNNKLKEIQKIFQDIKNIEFFSLKDIPSIPEIVEDGSTFIENALIKAKTVSNFCNYTIIADDSGLEVDALNGRPGIYSARYGGENSNDKDKNDLILNELSKSKIKTRKARFVCAIALILPSGKTFTAEGYSQGEISSKIEGANGFGYDPIFYLPNYQKTMAEIPASEKNKISHRADALKKIKDIMLKNKIISQ